MSALGSKIKPIQRHILVRDMNFGEQYTASGIYIPSDDGKSEGIKPRWGKVFAIGPEQDNFKVGEWILIEHGRWTRGVQLEEDDGAKFMVWRIDEAAVLLRADEKPEGPEFGKYTSPEHGSVHNPQDFIQPRL